MKAEDYDVVKVIGRGAFGEVQLVRSSLFCSYHIAFDILVLWNIICRSWIVLTCPGMPKTSIMSLVLAPFWWQII